MSAPHSGRVVRQIPMWDHFTLEDDRSKCNLCPATFSKHDRLAVFKAHLKNKHRIDVDVNDVSPSPTPTSTPRRRGLRSSTMRPMCYAESPPLRSPSHSPSPTASQEADPDYLGTQATVATQSSQRSEATVATQSTQRSYTPVKQLSGDESEDNNEAPTRSASPAGPPSVFTLEDSDTDTPPPPPKKRRRTSGSQNNNVANKPFDSWRDDSSWIVKKAEARDLDVRFVKNKIEITQDGGKSLIFHIKDAFVVVKTLDSDGDLEKEDKWQKGAGFVALVLGTIDVTFAFL
uniref:BED-type domain-containing protein n=1 Tax=Panagrellus redivivus TaxID=6233 RepID=A0A7E4VA09_PANRE